MVYLTGGRLTEILPKKYLFKHKYLKEKNNEDIILIVRNEQNSPIIESTEKVEHNYLGIQKRDITFQNINNIKVMVVSIENRKNKAEKRKTIPIPIEKEIEMVKVINNYIERLPYEAVLWPYSVSKGERLINKAFGLNAHFLRDIRATHLALDYGFTEYQLIMYLGWKDGRPAARYVRKDWKKLVNSYI